MIQAILKIPNNRQDVKRLISEIPRNAKYIMESSSVWYGLFCHMRSLKLDVVLSNPFNTKIDAYQLANMLRGGYSDTQKFMRSAETDFDHHILHMACPKQRQESRKGKIRAC